MVGIIIAAMYISLQVLNKNNMRSVIAETNIDMELLNLQQLANMAYSNIYFENLRNGIRRELTSEEICNRMLKNGIGDININKYNITVKNGDVFVVAKEEE